MSDDWRVTNLEIKIQDLENRVSNIPQTSVACELDGMYIDPYGLFISNLATVLGQRQNEGYNDLGIKEAIEAYIGSASDGRLQMLKNEVINFRLG